MNENTHSGSTAIRNRAIIIPSVFKLCQKCSKPFLTSLIEVIPE
jgi:hypothetical protein